LNFYPFYFAVFSYLFTLVTITIATPFLFTTVMGREFTLVDMVDSVADGALIFVEI